MSFRRNPIHIFCDCPDDPRRPIEDFTYGPISGTELMEEFDACEELYGVRPYQIRLELDATSATKSHRNGEVKEIPWCRRGQRPA